MSEIPVDLWQRELVRSTAKLRNPPIKVVVYPELDSTQDQARRLVAVPGAVIVAGRQTHGRGRFGRSWLDTGHDGVAMTFVMPQDRAERLAVRSAAAVALATDACAAAVSSDARPRIGIKWPNDVVVAGKKLAGVLIEQADGRAFVGIGVNVLQERWPVDLAASAVSLKQIGAAVRRIVLIQGLIDTVHAMWQLNDDATVRHYMRRDVLVGTVAAFRSGEREVRGKVLRVDPMHGLAVETDNGEVWLPAATTTVLQE